jgi:cytochrome P450
VSIVIPNFDLLAFTKFTQKSPGEADIASTFIKAFEAGGKTLASSQLLSGDTATLVVAGSDTTAPSLIILLYFLARYPEHANIVRTELEGIDVSDARALASLPHLNGIINESMRLLPAILTFSSRVTPPEGLVVEGQYIPGYTKICAPRYSIGRRK